MQILFPYERSNTAAACDGRPRGAGFDCGAIFAPHPRCWSAIAFVAGMAASGAAVAQTPEPVAVGPAVTVIGTTPLPGMELPRDEIPSNIQTLDAAALRDGTGVSLAETMQRRLTSVNVNEFQNNPYQADLNYRGFTASPLLGTPQGLSVFLDGVRVNEGFGDVVNWDLIPRSAIASMVLVPGSNPLYGLNTLGGAIALQTKRGDTHPGGEIELYGGSFDRRGGSIEQGGKHDEWSWFLSAEGMREDGWRDHSPTRVGQLFGKLAWTTAETDLALTLAHARTKLTGNGLLPESFERDDRESIFTYPDQTRNRSTLLALSGSHWFSDADQLSGTAYVRRTRTRTLNGDGNDEFEDEFEDWVADGSPLDEAPENGVLNRTGTKQTTLGAALQWSHTAGAHRFGVGASADRSRASFHQSEQGGELTDERGIDPDEEEEPVTSLLGRTRTSSVWLADTVTLAPTVHLTGSLRYNRTRVINEDRMGEDLNGDFTYHKLNPALGMTWQAAPALTLYGGYTQGSRAPTPIELGCADPENPCNLPNAMAADPFLDQVVTRTFELGARGRLVENVHWNASAYRSDTRDDILFIGSSSLTSAGYFTNFGKTRREGIELGLTGEAGPLDWYVSYNYIRATFRSSACLLAENNSTEGEGGCPDDQIRVSSGDRLPNIPRHGFKAGVAWRAGEFLRVGADMVGYSSQYVRGNENNAHRADEESGGRGKVSGYTVFNLNADYRLARGWTVFARVDNVFDKRYATGGTLGENPFTSAGNAFSNDPDAWRSEQFVAPGAPRAGWIGLRYRWGA